MAVEEFNGLTHELELAEGARVILTHNLSVEHGLMNGRQGVVRQIVYPCGAGPTDQDMSRRMPAAVVVEFPGYDGPAFFALPACREWVALVPRARESEHKAGIWRTQFPLVLGWAITPWKAQGMTLERVVVRLGRAGASPGVAFVALSRVRHPDHLMLDDAFPDMATITRQAQKPSFIERQHWERVARVKFSRTIRGHMRDPEWFAPEHLWTEETSELADRLLAYVREHPRLGDAALLEAAKIAFAGIAAVAIEEVWRRMQTFPHMFELAHASAA